MSRRLHLFEIEDLPSCPRVIRDGITDILQHSINMGDFYAPIVPILSRALARSGSTQVVDLCSGGGGPWPTLFPKLRQEQDVDVTLLLTDRFPNAQAFNRVRGLLGDRVSCSYESVSAFDVPESVEGFRTIFTGLHHFRPPDARRIIADAVRKNEGIGVFEFTQRRVLPMAFVAVMSPLGTLFAAPFAKPFRLSRLLLTYLIPVLPLCTLFDGVVSCLRTYSQDELRELVAGLPDNDYHWEIGEVRARAVQPLTYLVGYPAN